MPMQNPPLAGEAPALDYAPPSRRRAEKYLNAIVVVALIVVLLMILVPEMWRVEEILGARQGRAEADREWAAGTATIYSYGYGAYAMNVDEATGLPHLSVAGCMVNSRIEGRARGHNERIDALIAASGLPARSWILREPGVCDIKGSWSRRSLAGAKPLEVIIDQASAAPPQKLTIHGHAVALSAFEMQIDGARVYNGHWMEARSAEVLNGERDPDVIYLRWQRDDGPSSGTRTCYGALHLTERRWLRQEF